MVSHTLTTVSSSAARCRASRSVARVEMSGLSVTGVPLDRGRCWAQPSYRCGAFPRTPSLRSGQEPGCLVHGLRPSEVGQRHEDGRDALLGQGEVALALLGGGAGVVTG